MNPLKLSEDFTMPAEAVTQTFGILAVRGAGKSNTAAVFAEELYSSNLPFCVIDPVGSWYGLRATGTNKEMVLSIPIFGGSHGDVPLNANAGAIIANLIAGKRLSCVIDLSQFEDEASKKRFLLTFAKQLYLKNHDPLQLILEEADDYIPQSPMPDERQLLRAWENIVRRGRSRGLGITLITQRSAAINKMVLTQVETLITMRTTSPQDIAAIEAWVKYHKSKMEILESLSSLDDGEAWVWSPHFLKRIFKTRIRRRYTFDSGATPKNYGGTQQRKAATLADVNVDEIRKQLSDVVEQSKQDDPVELRKKISELKSELHKEKLTNARPKDRELQSEDRASIERLKQEIKDVAESLTDEIQLLHTLIHDAKELLFRLVPPASSVTPRAMSSVPTNDVRLLKAKPNVPKLNGEPLMIGRCASAILSTLAQFSPEPMTIQKIAVWSGYSKNSSGFSNSLSALRTRGLITPGPNPRITTDGLAAVENITPKPGSPERLIEEWKSKLDRCPRELLSALVEVYPNGMMKEELAARTNYSAGSSGFSNSLSHLRSLGLINKGYPITCSHDLFA